MFIQFLHKGTTRLAIEIYDNDSGLLYQQLISRYSRKDVTWLSRLVKWSTVEVNQRLQQFCEGTDTEQIHEIEIDQNVLADWTRTDAQPTEHPFTIEVRELTQLKQYARKVSGTDIGELLRQAFALPDLREPLLEWDSRDKLCCLDVDYHYVDPPTAEELESYASSVEPAPFAWHPSHGGGAKLYYISQPGYTALELAAVAGIHWLAYSPTATFDLVKSTRHPCFRRSMDNRKAPCESVDDIHYVYGSGDVSGLKRMLASEIDSDDVTEYLERNGWTYGQIIPHIYCPLNPVPYYKDTVFIGEKGIYCHHCQAKGIGGKNPGFVSYTTLIRGTDNRLRNMVKHFVHLEHAKIVLNNLYPSIPDNILDIVYRIMLKIIHSCDDPRVDMAMYAGRGFVRIKGQWVTNDGTTSLTDGLPRYLQSLPAVLHPAENGFSTDVPAFTALSNAGDIAEYGYYDVSFLRGCRIYGQKLQYPHFEVVKVVRRPEFENCPPTYLTESRRMPIEEAWKLLEQEFPGVSRTYITLLICTKGASEGRLAQCPFLLITGVSSAGKSTSVHIAAGICGDKADEPIFYPDVLRFRASLMDGAKTSGFLCVNEVFKMADRSKLSYTQALDPMLSLTEESRSHVLYVGSIPFGRLPVFVLTDIECPREILQDYQLARRFTFFRLDSGVDWTHTLVNRNIKPHEFRCISPEHALAADTILSDIIDTHFSTPTPLVEIAKKLGIAHTPVPNNNEPTPADSTGETGELQERLDLKEQLHKFYLAVIRMTPSTLGQHEARYNSAHGWRVIDRNTDNEILNTWNDVADGQQAIEWTRSRICHAEDWGKLLRVKFPVVLDIKVYQSGKRYLYVRFRSTDSTRTPKWINGEFR